MVPQTLTPDLLSWADEALPGYPPQYPPVAAWGPLAPERIQAAWSDRPASAPFGVYLHVPFCRQVCLFCGILYRESVPGPGRVDALVEALEEEARLYGRWLQGTVDAMFWGGGTPTLLSAAQLRRLTAALAGALPLASGGWFGIEANPESLDVERLAALEEAGLSYLSLGVQSLEDGVLAAARRPHTQEQARVAFALARRSGAALNVDLIAGLEGQQRRGFLRDVAEVAAWSPESVHLSWFKEFPSVPWVRMGRRRPEADRRAWVRWVEEGLGLLEARGYVRDGEFSAARPGFTRPWLSADAVSGRAAVLGLGPGAFSCVPGALRCQNEWGSAAYADAVGRGRPPVRRGTVPSPRQERIHTLLQAFAGRGRLEDADFERRFGELPLAAFGPQLRRLLRAGVLERREAGWAVKAAGSAAFELARTFYEADVVRALRSAGGRA